MGTPRANCFGLSASWRCYPLILFLSVLMSFSALAETVPSLPPPPTMPTVGGWHSLYPIFPGAPTGQAVCDNWKTTNAGAGYADIAITFLPTDSGFGGVCTRVNPWGPGVIFVGPQPRYVELCPPGYSSPAAGGVYPQTCTNVSADNRCPAVATGETPFKLDLPNKLTCSRPDQCLPPNVINPSTGKCEHPTYTVKLDRESATLEPSGTSAQNVQTSQTFIATVEDNDHNPKSGAVVTVRAEVKAKSGGHDHDDDKRPKGYLGSTQGVSLCDPAQAQPQSCIKGTTNEKGEFSFSFASPEASGTHTITATCEECNGGEAKANITVKIPGLVPLSASSQDYVLVGSRTTHSGNHYLTPAAKAVAEALAKQYHERFPNAPLLHFNDASLKDGGVLDICTGQETASGCASQSYKRYVPMCQLQPNGVYACSWSRPHIEHRRGTVIDIRANGSATSIPRRNEKRFLIIADRLGINTGIPHSPGSSNRHWHFRLTGAAE